MKLRPLIFGLATFIPGIGKLFLKGTGGTNSARYCYSVWLRHLVKAKENHLETNPGVVAELGPGDSIGIGLSALLSGTESYRAFDIVKYANNEKNIEIFEGLINLFNQRENIPDDVEFPFVLPHLDSYKFPSHILTDERLKKALDPERVERIRNDIQRLNDPSSSIQYVVPWNHQKMIQENVIDMIFSQAVLEHVDHLQETYRVLYRWLKPGGYMSHVIDFKSHNITSTWNGHWMYSEWMWKLIRGKRSYLINREPHSVHVRIINRLQLQIVTDIQLKSTSAIAREHLAQHYRELSEDDLTTEASFIQAMKKTN